MSDKDKKQIENNFTYHPVQPWQPAKYEHLRDQAKALAFLFLDMCPPSRERAVAMTKLEEAVMWANAAIARNEGLHADKPVGADNAATASAPNAQAAV